MCYVKSAQKGTLRVPSPVPQQPDKTDLSTYSWESQPLTEGIFAQQPELNAFDVLSGDSFDVWLDLLSSDKSIDAQKPSKPLPLFPALQPTPMMFSTPSPSSEFIEPEVSTDSKRKHEKFETVEPELAMKRAKNNEAARRSRERKLQKVDDLSGQVAKLESQKSELLIRVAVLDNERQLSIARERDLAHRVMALESQLGESHRALMSVGLARPSTVLSS